MRFEINLQIFYMWCESVPGISALVTVCLLDQARAC